LADSLDAALQRVETVTPVLLQTATWTGLQRRGTAAFYGYAVKERIEAGRQVNEVLALGYLLGTVRHFLGTGWQPERALVTGAHLSARGEIEALFGCAVTLGPKAGLVFPAHYLDTPNPSRFGICDAAEDEPIGNDLGTCVAHLIELGLDEARPSIDGIAGRLGLSRRTLQRRLEAEGTGYADIQRSVLIRRAKARLSADRLPIGRIGIELGYADAAHFSRAFLEWTGLTPRQWRHHVRQGTPA